MYPLKGYVYPPHQYVLHVHTIKLAPLNNSITCYSNICQWAVLTADSELIITIQIFMHLQYLFVNVHASLYLRTYSKYVEITMVLKYSPD